MLSTDVLDLHCISWTLQTSLDGRVRLPTLNYLAVTPLSEHSPTLLADCFDILISCVKVIDGEVVITQGMEKFVTPTALCCLCTLSHLISLHPEPGVMYLEDVWWQYFIGFPYQAHFHTLPSSYTLELIRAILFRWSPRWENYELSNDEHVGIAYALAKVSPFRCRWKRTGVPCWILRFVLHSLSRSPPPPTSVIVDCLSIIAIDLGCDISIPENFVARYVCNLWVPTSLTKN